MVQILGSRAMKEGGGNLVNSPSSSPSWRGIPSTPKLLILFFASVCVLVSCTRKSDELFLASDKIFSLLASRDLEAVLTLSQADAVSPIMEGEEVVGLTFHGVGAGPSGTQILAKEIPLSYALVADREAGVNTSKVAGRKYSKVKSRYVDGKVALVLVFVLEGDDFHLFGITETDNSYIKEEPTGT